jgi:flagellar biosynthesis/type III secretory pathway chaperone
VNQLWGELDTILTEMLKLYKALLVLSKQKREKLVKVQIQDIETIARQEEALILQIGKLEGLRKQIAANIAATHQLPLESLKLSKICSLVDKNQADRFALIDKEFNEVLKELIPLSKLNGELIQQSLSFINYNINLLTRSQVGPNYAPQGQATQAATPSALVDRRI